jgi:hypothetical protein
MKTQRLFRGMGAVALLVFLPAVCSRQPVIGSEDPWTAVFVRQTTPDVVDHRRFHGPIQHQGPRDTCVSFAVTAAMEGAYRRMDPKRFQGLKLSEQWAHHMQKMMHLDYKSKPPPAVPYRESELGCWGGGECTYMLRVLQQVGQTDAKLMPYVPALSYQDTDEPGDNPRLSRGDGSLTQRVIDDFNLDSANLPLTALSWARYRPTGVALLTREEARDPAFLERLLAAGYDVVVDFDLVEPESRTADGAWMPGDPGNPGRTPRARIGHSVLLVGYDRRKQYFLARNSWGYDRTDGGFTRIGYEYLRQWGVSGGVITAVTDPAKEFFRPALFLGRWQMNHDGLPGVLDIYRMPGIFTGREMRDQEDRRLGTYFDQAGRAYRVNGSARGQDLEFVIDFQNPNAPFGSLRGTRFQAKLFMRDEQTMAGLYSQDGMTYGFHAAKAPTPAHVAADATATPRDACLGRWKLRVDGIEGDLTLVAGSGANALAGSYREGRYGPFEVRGEVRGQEIAFQIKFRDWQTFSGRIYSRDRGLMSGVTDDGKGPLGFMAARQG